MSDRYIDLDGNSIKLNEKYNTYKSLSSCPCLHFCYHVWLTFFGVWVGICGIKLAKTMAVDAVIPCTTCTTIRVIQVLIIGTGNIYFCVSLNDSACKGLNKLQSNDY